MKKKASKDELIANVAVVKAKLRSNNNKLQSLSVPELKLLCKYKKKANDPKMPTKKADLIARYNQSKNNPSPTSSPQNSDDEDDGDDEGNSNESSNERSNESSDESSDESGDEEMGESDEE